jgi:hypothetical protein
VGGFGFNSIEPDQQAELRHDRAKDVAPKQSCIRSFNFVRRAITSPFNPHPTPAAGSFSFPVNAKFANSDLYGSKAENRCASGRATFALPNITVVFLL